MTLRALFAAVVVLAAGAVVVLGMLRGDDEPDRGLPAVVGREAPMSYRLVYQVTSDGETWTEEHIVHRPFDAAVVSRDADGEVFAESWTTLGRLVTRSLGADAVRVDTAMAPAGGDLRPDRFTDRLVEAGRVEPGQGADVGGRACRRSVEGAEAATADGSGATPSPVARCVDALGLVLEERWLGPTGPDLTKRAIELELGDDVPAVDIPDAAPLSAAAGNGAVTLLAPEATPPFLEAFRLPAPEGFTFVGRYAVVPLKVDPSGSAPAPEPDVALFSDVWRRGADVLLFDQGASRSGAAPFAARSELGPVEVSGLGAATLAVDLRIAEVRLRRPEGGFVRLAGTVPLDELLRLAGTITQLEVAR